MKRSATGAAELAAARNFQTAESAVPTAQQLFIYVDPALVYSRFDTALRPLLAMGAAFLPAVSDTVDLGKLPPADVITKHLSPIVMSQSYRGDGYVAESVGPVPLYQTVIGGVITARAASVINRQQTHGPTTTLGITAQPPFSSPSPSPSLRGSPQ